MNHRLCAVSVILACLVLIGPATAAPTVVLFEKPAAGNIKTIGIVTMAMPAQPSVWHMGGGAEIAGALTGGLGALFVGLAEQSVAAARKKEIWKEIDGDNHTPQTTFTNALTTALQANGFVVKLVAAPRSR